MNYDYMAPFQQPCLNPKSYKELPSPPKPDEILISIGVITWKRAKWVITGCIESIYEENKSFPTRNYEVILVDDATEGPRRKDLMDAIDQLLREYPNHNFRAYLLTHTRTWIDSHTHNVAWRRSLGRIIMQNQADLVHRGEVLESAWRHHSHIDPVRVWPAHYILYRDGSISEEWMDGGPTEFGASYPKWCVHQVKGKDERVIAVENYIHFQRALITACNMISIKDPSAYTMHVAGSHPIAYYQGPWWNGTKITDVKPPDEHPKKRLRKGAPRYGGPSNRGGDGSWTDGDWGILTPEEERNVVMTEAMKNVLKDA